jgi:hypothetical protein
MSRAGISGSGIRIFFPHNRLWEKRWTGVEPASPAWECREKLYIVSFMQIVPMVYAICVACANGFNGVVYRNMYRDKMPEKSQTGTEKREFRGSFTPATFPSFSPARKYQVNMKQRNKCENEWFHLCINRTFPGTPYVA